MDVWKEDFGRSILSEVMKLVTVLWFGLLAAVALGMATFRVLYIFDSSDSHTL